MSQSDTRVQARLRLRESSQLLKRAGRKLDPDIKQAIGLKQADLREALKADNARTLASAADALDKTVDEHLASYRKPAWRESFDSVFVAVIIALLLRSFVLEAFKIPSGSMIPTLSIGDQIFVNKLLYGIRIPFTSIRLIDFSEPDRGDVIVFICPCPSHEDFIKRVVAIPGDSVQVKRGKVFINGIELPRNAGADHEYRDRSEHDERWYRASATKHQESNGEATYSILVEPSQQGASNFGPRKIPEGEVFVMGDNRDHSYDSRMWGTVPMQNILGKAMFVWWSWGQDGLRWERLGRWIN